MYENIPATYDVSIVANMGTQKLWHTLSGVAISFGFGGFFSFGCVLLCSLVLADFSAIIL